MFNKYFFLLALLFVGGCSSIPEVSVPNIPFIEKDEVEVEVEVDAEIDPVAELKSRGDGYLSFNYNSGHLERIMVKLKDEQIVISKGQTIVKKLPVGKYSFDVSGDQIDSGSFPAELTYNGQTHQYLFYIPSQNSKIGFRSISNIDLNHKLGLLVVGSILVDPKIELTKLDQPPNVLEITCGIGLDLVVGDIFSDGRVRGKIAKVINSTVVTGVDLNGNRLYDIKSCGYSNNVTYTSPLRMSLPEGLYRMNASGESKNVYIRGENVNNIEITSNGFEGSMAKSE
jgi:hypothetical protein